MRPLLLTLGWMLFSVAYFFGVMVLGIGIFGPQGSVGTLVALVAAVLLWGYFTAYLISAARARKAKDSDRRPGGQ